MYSMGKRFWYHGGFNLAAWISFPTSLIIYLGVYNPLTGYVGYFGVGFPLRLRALAGLRLLRCPLLASHEVNIQAVIPDIAKPSTFSLSFLCNTSSTYAICTPTLKHDSATHLHAISRENKNFTWGPVFAAIFAEVVACL